MIPAAPHQPRPYAFTPSDYWGMPTQPDDLEEFEHRGRLELQNRGTYHNTVTLARIRYTVETD
jgi:hypothetical protein